MHIVAGRDLPPTAMSEMEEIAIERYATGSVVLELGAEYGFSTLVMARVAKMVFSVDWHRGYSDASIGPTNHDTAFNFMYNIKEARDRVVPLIGSFYDVLPMLKDAMFDFVFLDGGHDYESTRFCFEQALRLVKPGKVFACHDYGHPLCSEQVVAHNLGLTPRNPVINTLAIFDV